MQTAAADSDLNEDPVLVEREQEVVADESSASGTNKSAELEAESSSDMPELEDIAEPEPLSTYEQFIDHLYGSYSHAVDWRKAAGELGKDSHLADLYSLLLQAERGDYKDWYLRQLKLGQHDHVVRFAELSLLPWLSRMVAAVIARAVHGASWPSKREDKEALCCLVGDIIHESKVCDNPTAQTWLGWCYANGLGVEPSDERAIELWKQASPGNCRALYWLSEWTTETQFRSTAAWRGFPPAQYRLSETATTLDLARGWWEVANAQQYAPAQMHAVFSPTDMVHLEAAAQVGHPLACVRLASRLHWLGTTADGALDARIVSLYKMVVACDSDEYPDAVAEAHRSLGLLHLKGCEALGVAKDWKSALTHLEKCAKMTKRADVQFQVGQLYAQLKGVDARSRSLALEWYTRAAEQGHVQAQFCVGEMQRTTVRGVGMMNAQASATEAAHWLQKAASRDHARAKAYLGTMYENGTGVEQNKKRALQLYRESAQGLDASGQYFLAWCHEIGMETARDDQRAIELYTLACKQGHTGAKHRLYEMISDGRDGGKLNSLKKISAMLMLPAEQNQLKSIQELAECHMFLAEYWLNRKALLRLCESESPKPVGTGDPIR